MDLALQSEEKGKGYLRGTGSSKGERKDCRVTASADATANSCRCYCGSLSRLGEGSSPVSVIGGWVSGAGRTSVRVTAQKRRKKHRSRRPGKINVREY